MEIKARKYGLFYMLRLLLKGAPILASLIDIQRLPTWVISSVQIAAIDSIGKTKVYKKHAEMFNAQVGWYV